MVYHLDLCINHRFVLQSRLYYFSNSVHTGKCIHEKKINENMLSGCISVSMGFVLIFVSLPALIQTKHGFFWEPHHDGKSMSFCSLLRPFLELKNFTGISCLCQNKPRQLHLQISPSYYKVITPRMYFSLSYCFSPAYITFLSRISHRMHNLKYNWHFSSDLSGLKSWHKL